MSAGVVRRTLVSGERVTICEFTLTKGAVIAPHNHEHEQAGYVARGRLSFVIGGEGRELCAGDGYVVPANVTHAVTALEDSIAIDAFSPPRLEYMDS
ncbi:MAG: cupin domain-containing protein [Dehalococcoidia bacterium]|nr:cupin domain-containing protein [Dehalococcoidia bacterium]